MPRLRSNDVATATVSVMRRVLATAVLAALTALSVSAPALGQDILNDFRRSGGINPCNYSDDQLRRGLNGLPPDIQQYAPGLADQLAGGREGCGGGGGGGGGGEPAAAAPASSGGGGGPGGSGPAAAREIEVPAPPAPAAKARRRLADIATPTVAAGAAGADTPGWLAPLLACLALAAILFTLARFGGWSPERFTRPLRASLAEAGGRTADALTELRESVRLGR